MSPAGKKRMAVLGSRSVGKSSLVNMFVHKVFEEPYHPTIEVTSSKTVVYNGEEYECDIIDTAGQDEFTILNQKHAIGIHGYILVYSIAARPSFEMIKILYDKIVDCWGVDKIPCVIVGSKCDLELGTKQRIDSKVAEEFAKELGCAWIETSAKKGTNVDKVFELCLQEIEKHKQEIEKNKPAGSDKTPTNRTASLTDKCIVQ